MAGQTIRFEGHGVSHTGCVRELNEDRLLMQPEGGLWLIADGMGGHDAGEKASESIISHTAGLGIAVSAPDLQARFINRISQANKEIYDMSQAKNGSIMGSTVAAFLTFGGQYACAWSGDSRVYRIRQGALEQITRDHTEVQQLFDRGMITEEEAENWPRKNVITQAIGVHPELMLEINHGTLEIGDYYILCSDGLTAHVEDDEIFDAVYGRMPQQSVEILIENTLSRGATDNVTVAVVKCMDASATIPVSDFI